MAPSDTTVGSRPLRAELEAAGVPTFRAEIPLLTAYERAYNAGVPVYGVKGDPHDQCVQPKIAFSRFPPVYRGDL